MASEAIGLKKNSQYFVYVKMLKSIYLLEREKNAEFGFAILKESHSITNFTPRQTL